MYSLASMMMFSRNESNLKNQNNSILTDFDQELLSPNSKHNSPEQKKSNFESTLEPPAINDGTNILLTDKNVSFQNDKLLFLTSINGNS